MTVQQKNSEIKVICETKKVTVLMALNTPDRYCNKSSSGHLKFLHPKWYQFASLIT